MAAIALALAVLIPLQIASATMARLWRPAHYHAAPPAAAVESHPAAFVIPARFTAVAPDVPVRDPIQAAIQRMAVATGSAASADRSIPAHPPQPAAPLPAHRHPPHPHPHPHPHSHSHPHSHPHPHSSRKPHAHADAETSRRSLVPQPQTETVADHAGEPLPAIEHPHDVTAANAAHTHAHAAGGIGHHRHDRHQHDVVYLDERDAPDARTPRPQLDGTVMLLPTPAPLPGVAATRSGMPGARTPPLALYFAMPPDRPPS